MLCVLITVALLCAYVSRMATHCFAMLFFFRAAFVLNFFLIFQMRWNWSQFPWRGATEAEHDSVTLHFAKMHVLTNLLMRIVRVCVCINLNMARSVRACTRACVCVCVCLLLF